MSMISFPGLGIGPFEINKIAFSIGPLDVRWYGICIVIGMILGVAYALKKANQSGISTDSMLDYVLFAIPSAIIGARLYYVLFDLSSFRSLYDVIAIWEGGLAIYGGIIGGFFALLAVARFKKQSFPLILDCVAPAVMIGQILGRWGNFFNAEAYGTLGKIAFPFVGDVLTPALSDSYIFRMVIENSRVGSIAVHPTFLYESLFNLIGFIIIALYFSKKKFDGEIALMYLCWYGFGRFFIEGLRADSLMTGSLRVSQLLAFACFVTGIVLIVAGRKAASKKSVALDGYIKQFETDTTIS